MAIDQKLLGKAIRKVRNIRGLTQAQLARAAGLSEGGNSVALIERGQRGVSMESLNSIAAGLEVPAGCLTILATQVPPHDRDLKKLVNAAQQLVDRVVRLHALLVNEDAEGRKPPRTKKKKASARSPSRPSRRRPSPA